MSSHLSNIRFWVLLSTIGLSGLVYLFVYSGSLDEIPILELVRIYALLSLVYLYITLALGPAVKIFTWLPYRALLIKSRRAFGVSVFYFAFLHGTLALFNIIGGISGFVQLPFYYQIAILLGDFNLIILMIISLTSNDYMIEKLTFRKWKNLHRLVYAVLVFTLIHATLIGHHFTGNEKIIGDIFWAGAIVLVGLHGYGLYLKRRLTSS